ncbi:fimbrial protein [Pseudomonas sp. R5(2019)]|uniref:fimbrial protein n=1 Tax=Pseudomonas sp. R5(2019) TaxID=2697566 RepID=UPI001411EBD5|nr:fimbrial protein [Pseudomonas sp. R5(2019)]NBA97394.1 fimbrial protein [Pseudomonas sp. R5(2019)]
MRTSLRPCLATLLVALLHQTAAADCVYTTGSSFTATRNLGTVWVARDARVGAELGTFGRVTTPAVEGSRINCNKPFGTPMTFRALSPTGPILSSGGLASGAFSDSKILPTSIQGVGAIVQLWRPFNGQTTIGFAPIDEQSSEPRVPFTAQTTVEWGGHLEIVGVWNRITLVKTGPMRPGPHSLDDELVVGELPGLPRGFTLRLNGTINQAQCGVTGSPVDANPVRLGTFDTRDFTGQGSSTPAVDFKITLSDCQTNAAEDIAVAHIRLEGILGSVPHGNRADGIFTLTTDSDATGVGIQVLRADGVTPVALDNDVPIQNINNGVTVLGFKARLYQIADSVEAGWAKGALKFTLTYQ